MNIDRANGIYRLRCIIMDRGFIPVLNCRGPILNPRLMDVNEVRLLIKLGVDIRMVGNDNRLDLVTVDNMVNEFINGPKKQPVVPQVQHVKKEEEKPVVDKSEPVVKQPVVEEPVKVQEEVKPEQPKNNKQNKQNKNKK